MSAAKAALDALENAGTVFKQRKTLLHKALNTDPKSERSLTIKMNSLTDALTAVNQCHTSWVSKSGLSETELVNEKYNSEWLENVWTDADILQELYDSFMEQLHPAVTAGDQQLAALQGQFESLKLDVSSRFDTLLTKTSSANQILNSTALKVYEGLYTEVHQLFSVELPSLSNKISSLDPQNATTFNQNFEQFKRSHQVAAITIQTQLADQLNTSPVAPPTPLVHQTKGIEMEKSKAPTFSGNTIDYPEFKRGWQKVPGVYWSDGNQVEQIKYKVDSETRRIISRCNTMKEVWEVLDAEFAQEQEVVNAVICELKKLHSMDCSVPEYIVKLRNYLPTLETALSSVSNGFEHLSSPTQVEYLASKFDAMTLKDWDYFKSHHTGTTYERFIAFLKDQYDACRSSIARSKAITLVSPAPAADPRAEGFVHHTGGSTTNECRRCQKWYARDKPYTCPACGRGTAVNDKLHHCVEHCGVK